MSSQTNYFQNGNNALKFNYKFEITINKTIVNIKILKIIKVVKIKEKI